LRRTAAWASERFTNHFRVAGRRSRVGSFGPLGDASIQLMPRDLVAQVLEVKGRRVQGGALDGLRNLKRLWTTRRDAYEAVVDYFPMRAVTLLEVFTRNWLAYIIDHAPQYLENAELLVKSRMNKLDFAVLRAVHGARVTIGELVAHAVSVNGIGDIDDAFSAVLKKDFFAWIATVYDRYLVEREGQPKLPIITDLPRMKADIASLFRVRHIVTHELPTDRGYTPDDVEGFLSSAVEFAAAADQAFLTLLHGDYPLSTIDMQGAAAEALGKATDELEATYGAFGEGADSDLLRQSREAWEAVRRVHATLRSVHLEGGSYQGIAYAREATLLTEQQTQSLRRLLDVEEGEI